MTQEQPAVAMDGWSYNEKAAFAKAAVSDGSDE